jgi:hypothetical protein
MMNGELRGLRVESGLSGISGRRQGERDRPEWLDGGLDGLVYLICLVGSIGKLTRGTKGTSLPG